MRVHLAGVHCWTSLRPCSCIPGGGCIKHGEERGDLSARDDGASDGVIVFWNRRGGATRNPEAATPPPLLREFLFCGKNKGGVLVALFVILALFLAALFLRYSAAILALSAAIPALFFWLLFPRHPPA